MIYNSLLKISCTTWYGLDSEYSFCLDPYMNLPLYVYYKHILHLELFIQLDSFPQLHI